MLASNFYGHPFGSEFHSVAPAGLVRVWVFWVCYHIVAPMGLFQHQEIFCHFNPQLHDKSMVYSLS